MTTGNLQLEMLNVAREMQKRAYAPYSKYYVGACVCATDGTLFGGCNVGNSSYGVSICAEVSAICAMISAGKREIAFLAVLGSGKELCTPCGRCRQMISEFATEDTLIYLCDTNKICQTVPFSELFPMAFKPRPLVKITSVMDK